MKHERIEGLVLRRASIILAFGISIVLSLGYAAWYSAYGLGSDFSVYWTAANHPASSVYSDIPKLSFPYAPTMLLWVAPLKLVPQGLAYALWVAASLGALFWVCRRHLTLGESFLAIISPAAILCAATGQVTIALTAALLLSCGLRNRLLAGVILGCIATIKPQLVSLAPLFLVIRLDWKAFIGAGASFLAISLLSVAVFGAALWLAWFQALPAFQTFFVEVGVVMVTPMAVATKYELPTLLALLLGIGGAVAILARDYGPVALSAAIVCSSLLVAPYAVVYDLVALSPFLAWAAFRGSYAAAMGLTAMAHPLPLFAAWLRLANEAGAGVAFGNVAGLKGNRHRHPVKVESSNHGI